MLESAVEKPVVARAERRGWFVRKVKWIGRDGAPDRVFIKGSRTVWIEFKAPGEPPRLLQEDEHRLMRQGGAEVYVCDNVSDALKILGIA